LRQDHRRALRGPGQHPARPVLLHRRLIARGDLGYEEAYAALLEAACAMPVHRDPWRNLEERVARSIESGMERPLALSETEQWVRNFRARMRRMRPAASAGARNG
jgi:hypothetical protein